MSKNVFFIFLSIGLVIASWNASAQISAQPNAVSFRDYGDLVEIIVSNDGALVPKSQMGRAQFLVDGNNYIRMIDVQRHDGVLVLRPTQVLEAGRYTLVIDVAGTPVTISVNAPLDRVPGSIEAKAAEAGVSVDEMKRAMGLATMTERASVDLSLSPQYPLGTRIEVTMPVPGDDKFTWYVNDAPTEVGTGSHTFGYVLSTAGSYNFRYVETAVDGGIIETSATTEAYDEAAIPFATTRNQPVLLRKPAGYDSCIWQVNDVTQGATGDLTYSFRSAGVYTVTCRASRADGSFRALTYEVTVE